MSLANPNEGANKLTDLFKQSLTSEPQEPTETAQQAQQDPQEAEEQTDAEGPSRKFKANWGDREVEYQILSELNDDEAESYRLDALKDADYRKKTMSLSDERKGLGAKSERLDETLTELESLLTMDVKELESEHWKEVKETDPEAYIKRYDEIKAKAERFNEFKERRQRELVEQQQTLIDKEQALYAQTIPDWVDDGKKASDLSMIGDYLKETGFSESELGNIYDRRLLKIARDAALFNKMKSSDLEKKRVDNPPKSIKSGAKNPAKSRTDIDELKSAFRKNPSSRNNKAAATKLFERLLQ
jgi:hypothetical protein